MIYNDSDVIPGFANGFERLDGVAAYALLATGKGNDYLLRRWPLDCALVALMHDVAIAGLMNRFTTEIIRLDLCLTLVHIWPPRPHMIEWAIDRHPPNDRILRR